jgi:hypothetical protein
MSRSDSQTSPPAIHLGRLPAETDRDDEAIDPPLA